MMDFIYRPWFFKIMHWLGLSGYSDEEAKDYLDSFKPSPEAKITIEAPIGLKEEG